jgi:hypothetical protein
MYYKLVSFLASTDDLCYLIKGGTGAETGGGTAADLGG